MAYLAGLARYSIVMFPARPFVCLVFVNIYVRTFLVRNEDSCNNVQPLYKPTVVSWTTGDDTDEDSKYRTVVDEDMTFQSEGAILGFKFWVGNYEPNEIRFEVFNRGVSDSNNITLRSTTRSVSGDAKMITVDRSLMNWPAVVHCCNTSENEVDRIRPLRIFDDSLLGWSGQTKGLIDWNNEGGNLRYFAGNENTYDLTAGTKTTRKYVYQVEYLNGSTATCIHGIEDDWSQSDIETWVAASGGDITIGATAMQCLIYQASRLAVVLLDKQQIKASGVLFKVDIVGEKDTDQQFVFLSAKSSDGQLSTDLQKFEIKTESDVAWVNDDTGGKHSLKPAHMMHLTQGHHFGWWRKGPDTGHYMYKNGVVRCEDSATEAFYGSEGDQNGLSNVSRPDVSDEVELKYYGGRFHYRMFMWPYSIDTSDWA